ncbi:hypothetical protein [Pseudaestuariivita sp.]|uniref:hypothetical protein n=1 Tax=Pseudaestuariivita sp. TaxID=2211669 RepID=UPI004057D2F7
MSQINELEGRISAALDRIARGLENAPDGGGEESVPAEVHAALQAALEDEKTANAQLEERIKSLTERHAAEVADLQAQLESVAEAPAAPSDDGMRNALDALEIALEEQRGAHHRLQKASAALREAVDLSAVSADQINDALAAELEAERTARATDQAEVGAILVALDTRLAKPSEGDS